MLIGGCGDSNDSGGSGPSGDTQFTDLTEDEEQQVCDNFVLSFDRYLDTCEDRNRGELTCDAFTSAVSSCSTALTVAEIRGCGSALSSLSCGEDGVTEEPQCDPLNDCLDGDLSNPDSDECPEGEVFASGPGIDDGCYSVCTSEDDCQPEASCSPASNEISICISN
ncbi:MAG: hypothetical protein ACLFVJ_22850 [Persicimonas sp.]